MCDMQEYRNNNSLIKVETPNVDVLAPTDKEQIIKETCEFWESRTGQSLTDEDAREIIENITGFFKIIAKWDSKAKEKK